MEMTLFFYQGTCDYVIQSFNNFKKVITLEFLTCADSQLTPKFIARTGLNFGKNVCISTGNNYMFNEKFKSDTISILPFCIYINHNWNPITVCWQSKSGRIYKIEDTDIDCNDIEFWFEGLDPLLYHKQLYPNDKLPFRFKDLPFDFVVERLNMEATIGFEFKTTATKENILAVIEKHNKMFNFHTINPVHNDIDKGGFVKRFEVKPLNDTHWEYEIDTGDAGPLLYKKMVQKLKKEDCILKITIA